MAAFIAGRIKTFRDECGLSQRALAQALRIGDDRVGAYERGSAQVTAARLAMIAAALGRRPADFYGSEAELRRYSPGGEFSPIVSAIASMASRLPGRVQRRLYGLLLAMGA